MDSSAHLLPAGRSRALRPGRALVRLAIAAVLAGAGILLWRQFQAGPAPRPTAAIAAPVPVTVAIAETRDLDVWFTGVGTVRPLNVVDVKVRVDGQLQSVAFTEGQEVAAGQVLAQVDPRPYKAALDQAQANLRKNRALHANAQGEVARAGKLASAGAGSTQALETARAQLATLAAQLDADEAAIDLAELNLGFTRVASPIAGRLGMRQIDPGSLVRSNDASGLVTVTQMQPIAAVFSLPQDQLDSVQQGQATGPLKVVLRSRDGATRLADGALTFVNSTVDPVTGQIQLKAEFANTERRLWPGQFVSVRLLARTDRGVVAVPAQAVLTGQNGLYVYVVKPDDTVAVQAVTVGPTVSNITEIRAGLAAGDKIVLDGQSRLAPGARVTYTQAAKP